LNEVTLQPVNEATGDRDFVPSQAHAYKAELSFFFVWLFTVAIYARPEDIVSSLGQFHVTFALGFCAGLAYLGSFLLGKVSLVWPKELRIVLLLTCCYAAGVPFAYWRGGSFQMLIQVWSKTLFVFFLLTQTVVTLERVRKLLWAVILSELFVCTFAIVHPSSAIWVGDRMLGVNLGILGWNFLGIAAALAIPYIGAIYVTQPSFLKTSLLIASVLSLMWMLVLTASRSGVLNVIFSIALTSLLVLRGSSRGRFMGAGIALLLILAISLAPEVFWQRMRTVWSDSDVSPSETASSARASESDRLAVLNRSIQYTLQNPLFGLGLGNLEVASGTELGRPDAWIGAHNTFAQISSEAGLPALVLFVALLWTTSRSMKRLGKTIVSGPESVELKLMARATLVSLLSFVFGAFFAHIAYEYFLFYPVAIGVGIQHIATTLPAVPTAAVDQLTSIQHTPVADRSA